LNPEKWEQVKELLGSALERAPAERIAFLHDACGSDEGLRAELEALLAAYDSEKSTLVQAPPAAPFAPAELAEKGIGPYRLIRQIGMGGMGAVYLAVRADDTFSKKVAIKLVQTGIDSQEILQRFRHDTISSRCVLPLAVRKLTRSRTANFPSFPPLCNSCR
jgi:hypothetical protein